MQLYIRGRIHCVGDGIFSNARKAAASSSGPSRQKLGDRDESHESHNIRCHACQLILGLRKKNLSSSMALDENTGRGQGLNNDNNNNLIAILYYNKYTNLFF